MKTQVHSTFDKPLGLGDEVTYIDGDNVHVAQVNRVTNAHAFIIVDGREIMFKMATGKVVGAFDQRKELVTWPVNDLHRKAATRRSLVMRAHCIQFSRLTTQALENIVELAEVDIAKQQVPR